MSSEINSNSFLANESVVIKGRIWHLEPDKHNPEYVLLYVSDSNDTKICRLKSDIINISSLTEETYIQVQGALKSDKRYKLDDQIIEVESLTQLSNNSKSRNELLEKLPSIRFLYIRKPEIRYLLQIKRIIRDLISEYLERNGYVFVETPSISSFSQTHRKAMEVLVPRSDYTREKSKFYLVQKPQFYLDAFAHTFDKVYTIAPVFRTDKKDSDLFLAEFWLLDTEQLFSNFKDQLSLVEQIIKYVVSKLLKDNFNLFVKLIKYRNIESVYEKDVSICDLPVKFWEEIEKQIDAHQKFMDQIKNPFPRLKYSHAVEILNNEGEYFQSHHIGERRGKILTEKYNSPVFITEFPFAIRQFYDKKCSSNSENTHTFDLIGNLGYGEIASGGEREENATLIKKQILEKRLRLESNHTLQWYHQINQYGSVPHAGFSIGIERITAWITQTKLINKTIGFSRRLVGSDIQY